MTYGQGIHEMAQIAGTDAVYRSRGNERHASLAPASYRHQWSMRESLLSKQRKRCITTPALRWALATVDAIWQLAQGPI